MVIGFFQLAGKSGGYLAYTTYDFLSDQIHQSSRAVTYRITASRGGLSLAEQEALGAPGRAAPDRARLTRWPRSRPAIR